MLGARCNLFDEREAPSFDSERATDVTSLTRGVPVAGGSFVWLPAQTEVGGDVPLVCRLDQMEPRRQFRLAPDRFLGAIFDQRRNGGCVTRLNLFDERCVSPEVVSLDPVPLAAPKTV